MANCLSLPGVKYLKGLVKSENAGVMGRAEEEARKLGPALFFSPDHSPFGHGL